MKRCSCLLEFTWKVNRSACSSIIKDLAYIRDTVFERFQVPWNVSSIPCCRDSNGRKRKAQSFKSVLQACYSNCTRASDICENTRFKEDVALKIYHRGEVGQYRYILQGSFQRLKLKCKCWWSDCYTSLFGSLCLCLLTYDSPWVYFVILNCHISYLHILSSGNGIQASEAVFLALFSVSPSLSRLPAPTLICHAFSSPPLILSSTSRAF